MKSMRLLVLGLTLVLSLGSSSEACDSFYLPDYMLSVAWLDGYPGPEQLSIMVVPDGTGDALEMAFLPDGTHVSGVISVMLVDVMGRPKADHCREQIELASQSGSLTFCPEGNLPESHTDAGGMA